MLHPLRDGLRLDVNAESGQASRQPGILSLAANRQTQLHIRNGALGRVRFAVDADGENLRRTERMLDESARIAIPLDHVDTLAVQFIDDVLNAHRTHPDAAPNRVNPLLPRPDGDLGAVSGLSSDAANLNHAAHNLGHFQLKQPPHEVGARSRDHDLRSLVGAQYLDHDRLDALARAVALHSHLLLRRHHRLGVIGQLDDHLVRLDALDITADHPTLFAGVLGEDRLALRFAQRL